MTYNKVGKLTFDEDACMMAIQDIMLEELEPVEEKLIEILKTQIKENSGSRHKWREEAASLVQHLLMEATDEYIEIQVGFDEKIIYSLEEFARIRVLVALTGNDHDPPLRTKPGQQTLNKHITVRRMSPALYRRKLPDSWTHKGLEQNIGFEKIEENAQNEIQKYYWAALTNALNRITGDFLSQFLTVSW